MKALVWHGKEDIRCETVSDPAIEDPRDAIVKVTSCAICGSDLHLFHNFIEVARTESRAYGKGVNMPRTILWIFAAVGITLSGSMPVPAQEVQQSTAIVNRDVMNQISAFSYREGPESELLLTGTPLAPAASIRARCPVRAIVAAMLTSDEAGNSRGLRPTARYPRVL